MHKRINKFYKLSDLYKNFRLRTAKSRRLLIHMHNHMQ